MMNKKKFTSETTLEKVFAFPNSELVLSKHQVPCLGCPMAKIEASTLTIGQVSQMYGLDEAALIADLNNLAADVAQEKGKPPKS